ncbi:MAG: M48 family metallopeptidase [bacterium]|nr:M48 family metallopeptidase [bacterium]
MNEQTILILLIGITIFDFLLERILTALNYKSSKKPIPEKLEGIYDQDQYSKSQEYHNVLNRFGNFSATLGFIAIVAILYFGFFGTLHEWLKPFASNDVVLSLLFFGVLYIVSDIMGLPFSIYGTFVIEEKFGFNNTTVKTFILDKIKGYLLTIIVGGLLISTLLYLIWSLGSNFWIYFWIVITAFILLANMFYTTLILPLFNKLKPMEDGELKEAIAEYAKSVDFPLVNIFVIDGSKRSSKGNAFFSGFGKRKKVVLYDTLIEKHTTDELVAVFAHEVGHYKKKHIILGTVLSILQTGVMLFLLSRMIYSSEVSYAMGGDVTLVHLNILAFGILYSPLSRIIGILMNVLSRKNEYEADEYAVKTFKKEPLQDALKKLSGDNLSNLTPHSSYVFVHYSHPTLLQRVDAMDQVVVD